MRDGKRSHWGEWADHNNIPMTEDIPVLGGYSEAGKKAPRIHSHDQFEIGLCIKGSGIFFIQDKLYPFRAGDISIIFPGDIHIAQSVDEEPSLWIFISTDIKMMFSRELRESRSEFDNMMRRKPFSSGIFAPDDNEALAHVVRKISRETVDKPEGWVYMTRLLFAEMILLMSRDAPRVREICENGFELSQEQIMPAILYITNNYRENIGESDLAAMCHISEGHLRRLFVSSIGFTPLQYLHKTRINYACALLRSKKSVAEASEAVGYATTSSFYRQFKKYVGCVPGKYR